MLPFYAATHPRGLPAPVAPIYSLPLAYAFGNCPKCETTFRFVQDRRRPDLLGRQKRCKVCGTVLGLYLVDTHADCIVWLRVVCS